MGTANNVSEREVDVREIADKMLDNFNLYLRTGEKRYLADARKFADTLNVDHTAFPSLFREPDKISEQ